MPGRAGGWPKSWRELTPQAHSSCSRAQKPIVTTTSTSVVSRIDWPRGSRPADFHAPFRSALPVLVLDGQLDPVTPPAYGAAIVSHLMHARQLIAAGQGHGVIGAGCMPRLVQRFVETLDAAHLDAACLAALGPIPAFLDYDGASP